MCSSDPKPPSPEKQAKASYEAALKYLPGIFELENQNIGPNEQATLDAAKKVAPGYTQLSTDILKGPGSQLIDETLAQQKKIDPEFFASRAAGSDALVKLLSSIDLSGMLSGSEAAEIERNLNRTDAGEVDSALKTVKHGMEFGSAAQKKKETQQALGTGAVNAATGFLPASRTGIDPLQVATGKSAYAPGQIGGGTLAGSQAFMGAANDAASNQAILNAQRRSGAEKALGALPDY